MVEEFKVRVAQCLLVDEDQTTIHPKKDFAAGRPEGTFSFCPGSEGGRLREEVKGDGEKRRRHASLTRS